MNSKEYTFKIGQLAKACSISRATILRMEEDGLLSPSRKDPDSGYRYYSIEDLLIVRQVLYLRGLGFKTDSIRRHLDTPADPSPLLLEMEAKVRELNKTLWVLQRLVGGVSGFSPSIMEAPVRNYFMRTCIMKGGAGNLKEFGQKTLGEAVEKGVRLDQSRGIFISTDRTDILHGSFSPDVPYLYTFCIPTLDPPGGDIVSYPAQTILSFLWDGDYTTLLENAELLGAEAYRRRLLPLGPIGGEILLPLIDTNGSSENEPDHQLFRMGFPVMRLEETGVKQELSVPQPFDMSERTHE